MKKYISYYRKSTDSEEKQILSLSDQRRVTLDFCNQRQLFVPNEYHFEESCSAKKAGRPIFNEVIKLLKDRKADGLIAYKADRLTRNYTDLGTIMDLLESGIEIWAVDYGQYKNNSNDKTMIGLNTVMAKRKIDDLSEDVKRSLYGTIKEGRWAGWAPLGYLNCDIRGRITGKSYTFEKQGILENLGRPITRVEKDLLVAPLIKRMFEIYAYQPVAL